MVIAVLVFFMTLYYAAIHTLSMESLLSTSRKVVLLISDGHLYAWNVFLNAITTFRLLTHCFVAKMW